MKLRIPALAAVYCLVAQTQAQDVRSALSFYDAVVSVHLEADFEIVRDGVEGQGQFKYWEDGERYRIICSTDPSLGLMGDVEYAYDGSTFRSLQREIDTLTISANDSAQVPTAVPNPFFLPVGYLSRDDDTCPGCALRLRDLKNDPKVRSTRLVNGVLLTLNATDRVIEWLRPDETRSSSVSWDQPVGAPGFPRRIVLRDFAGDGHLWTSTEIVIRVLEINANIAPNIFEIPAEAASRVWDESEEEARRPSPSPR
jgi:hypothetical protein